MQCVRDQYAQYMIVDDIKINSKLTAARTWPISAGRCSRTSRGRAAEGQAAQPADGLTPDQRFFVGFAQWACENERPENLRVSAITNPHSPGKYRINGIVADLPQFARAFSCKAGAPMARSRCRVW